MSSTIAGLSHDPARGASDSGSIGVDDRTGGVSRTRLVLRGATADHGCQGTPSARRPRRPLPGRSSAGSATDGSCARRHGAHVISRRPGADARAEPSRIGAGGAALNLEDARARLAALQAVVAERHDGRCLSERYTRQAAKYAFECARGHRFAASASNVIHRGSWCAVCAGNAPLDAAALSAAADSIEASIDPERPFRGAGALVGLVCHAGHRFELRAATLADGRAAGCPTCREQASTRSMLERAGAAAGRNGLSVVGSDGPGRRALLTLRCRCGHVFERGAEGVYLVGRTRCPRCRGAVGVPDAAERLRALPRSASKTTRHALLAELVRERHGGRLLSTDWDTLQSRYRFRCAKAHGFSASAANVIHRGSWCPACAGNARLSLRTYAALAASRGGALVPGQRVDNRHTRLRFRCARDHVFELALQNLGAREDGWCARCALIDQREAEYRALSRAATLAGYRLLSPKIRYRKEALLFECPAGHEWRCRSWDFRTGTRCGVCFAASGAAPSKVHGERNRKRPG